MADDQHHRPGTIFATAHRPLGLVVSAYTRSAHLGYAVGDEVASVDMSCVTLQPHFRWYAARLRLADNR